MLTAFLIYVVPAWQSLNGRQVTYLIVTIGASTALLTFAWLELRSHRDA